MTYEQKYGNLDDTRQFKPILDYDMINGIGGQETQALNKEDSALSNLYFTTNNGFDTLDKVQTGPSSNFMTSIKQMRYLLSVTFLVAPVGLKELGIQTFSMAVLYTILISIFTVWLQLNSERRFRDGNQRISSLKELTHHCFGESIN
jgi:hypothetical protein